MDNFYMFWYMGIGIWVLLGLSVFLTFFALKKLSWKAMVASTFISIPNTFVGLLGELENVIMYSLLIWFVVQILMTFILYKKGLSENKML